MRLMAVPLICLMTLAAYAQAPAFEAASVKQVDSALPNIQVRGWSCHGSDSSTGHPLMVAATGLGRCRVMGMSLKAMISSFFAFRADRITGGPGWIDSLPYTIEAKAESPETTRAQLAGMLQTMLTDRFQLKFHKETRDVSGYALVPGRNGPKLKDATSGSGSIVGPGSISGPMTTASLAAALSSRLAVPVTDATGLTARYDIQLKWTPVELETAAQPGVAPEPAGGPSLFTAIQEQLGLRLEPRTSSVEVMVIDSVEKASEN